MTSTTVPTVQVRMTAVLQKLTGGQKTIEAAGANVGDDGKLHRFVNVYLNDEDIRYMGGPETAVKSGDVLDILPALAGGC
jgi:molybdopterin converting factor small subunit